jgi:hypothetical protein
VVWQVHQTSLRSNSVSPPTPAQLRKSKHIYIPIQVSFSSHIHLTTARSSANPISHHNFVHRFQYISPSFLPFWTLLPIHASHRDQESPSRLPSTTLLHTSASPHVSRRCLYARTPGRRRGGSCNVLAVVDEGGESTEMVHEDLEVGKEGRAGLGCFSYLCRGLR